MAKAVLKNGLIYPVDPLPADWHEGEELDVQKIQTDALEDLDRYIDSLPRWYDGNCEESGTERIINGDQP